MLYGEFLLSDRISMGLWPHLPDKKANHFYFMGMLNGDLYNNKHCMEDDKKTVI